MLCTIDLTYRYPSGDLAKGISPHLRGDAISGLNLQIQSGSRLALLGANGSGKSTLLMHLNGTLKPAQGRVELEGRVMGYGRAELLAWRSRVALVFQDPDHQIFAGTVAEDISFGPVNMNLPVDEVHERVSEAMADLELNDFASLPPHMLSHGQRKRVALAGALAMRPKVLLLDEPTAGLDPRGESHLLKTLERFSSEGMTQVVSTHDLDLALEWATDVVILSEGALLAQGKPCELLQNATLMERAHLRVPYALRSHS